MVSLRAILLSTGLALLACFGLASAATAQDRTIPARDASLSVVVDPMPATPYEGEMVLVTVRGVYDVTIALEKLEQPELRNLGWTQLGRDSWGKERIDGREMTVFERRLALYPHGSGTLTISPFVHHLTLVANNGDRFVHDVVSEPVELAVRPRPATNGNWWLPARDIAFTDVWDRDPAMLGNGETATRTVTIRAVGVQPGSLPPPPKMVASWLIAFMAPEKRSVELTKANGPVSTVVWQWRFRPARAEPGRIHAFHIPWFDTESRQMRDIVLASQRIAFAAIASPKEKGRFASALADNAAILAALTGALAVLLALLPGRRFKSRAELAAFARRVLPDPDRRRLRRAAAANDWTGARRAIARLAERAPAGAAQAASGPLAAIDERLFSRETKARSADDLARIARSVLSPKNRGR